MAELIEGTALDVQAYARPAQPGYEVVLGEREAHRLVAELMAAGELLLSQRVRWMVDAHGGLDLAVASRVAALLLSAGAARVPRCIEPGCERPAVRGTDYRCAAHGVALDVEAASCGGQVREPYYGGTPEEIEAIRHEQDYAELSDELQRAYDQRDQAQAEAARLRAEVERVDRWALDGAITAALRRRACERGDQHLGAAKAAARELVFDQVQRQLAGILRGAS
jgi:hypothetical protein